MKVKIFCSRLCFEVSFRFQFFQLELSYSWSYVWKIYKDMHIKFLPLQVKIVNNIQNCLPSQQRKSIRSCWCLSKKQSKERREFDSPRLNITTRRLRDMSCNGPSASVLRIDTTGLPYVKFPSDNTACKNLKFVSTLSSKLIMKSRLTFGYVSAAVH